jgi:DNA helicase-2/ATP-dependent DNA helicase PcrA
MDVFEGLNPQQRAAVEAVRGPVCILAGAGSGKTTTITRRIANQVLTGAFAPSEILAVTFTDKAAGEMRTRLQRLGVDGVQARTFHSAALAQLRFFLGRRLGEILPSKALTLQPIRRSLPKPYTFRPLGDLASEIEWAKNRRLTPETYLRGLGGHTPPIPADLMVSAFRRYEAQKERQGRIDFEDLLERAIRLYDEDAEAARIFRERYRAFTVDEYQDVNLLQQSLLERWLGDRDELCVVGDDYQAIYSFTGATPEYLLKARGQVFRLEENYRSTPEILELANRLVPKLGGSEKVLRATRESGPAPVLEACESPEAEVARIVARIRELGPPYEEIAVLYRINARSEEFEETLSEAGIPYQVRGGAFLARPAARGMFRALRGATHLVGVADVVRRTAEQQGLVAALPDGVGEEEATRQGDLARFVRLAEEFGEGTVAEFLADLKSRFGEESEGRGVNLLTFHRAKGLEFDAVFLPRLEEGELPFKRANFGEALAEERRLLYVGTTRAKRLLEITWSGNPSRFLSELGVEEPERVAADDPVMKALKAWRLERARRDEVPAFVVFHDSTLREIARQRPRELWQLAKVAGVGPAKLERYGDEILETLPRP